ncbi:hypothetical protein [Capnocytophaga gingivalis]|nr:hypothetical protein [Capnocytophaga gingivalis]MEB3013294.1 hypothetical protein [Capnocytophaga gingivalis]
MENIFLLYFFAKAIASSTLLTSLLLHLIVIGTNQEVAFPFEGILLKALV